MRSSRSSSDPHLMIIENLMIREEDEDSHRIDNKCDESVNAIGHNA